MRPRIFLPALVKPLKTRPLPFPKASSGRRTLSTSTTSNHLWRPSCQTQYELRTSRLGKRFAARSSAISCMLFAGVNFVIPECRCRRPPAGRDFRRPPRRTLTRTTLKPCLALYPSVRARDNLRGRAARTKAGSRLQLINRCRYNSLSAGASRFFSSTAYLCKGTRLLREQRVQMRALRF